MRKIISDIAELGTVKAVTVIPSYHKGTWLYKVKNTFQCMCPIEDVPCVLFLQDHKDIEEYDWWIPAHIIIWCPPIMLLGIAQVRKYLQERCTEHGIEYLALLDDDLRLTYRISSPTKYYPICDKYVRKGTAKISAPNESRSYETILSKAIYWYRCGTTGYNAVISIVQRFGSQNKIKSIANGRILHFFIMNLSLLRSKGVCFSDAQPVCEDFRFLFDCAEAGLQTYTMTAFVQDDHINPSAMGGCNEWRNKDKARIHNEAVKKLAEDYPLFCTAVWENKSPYCATGAYNPRIDWKAVNKKAIENASK